MNQVNQMNHTKKLYETLCSLKEIILANKNQFHDSTVYHQQYYKFYNKSAALGLYHEFNINISKQLVVVFKILVNPAIYVEGVEIPIKTKIYCFNFYYQYKYSKSSYLLDHPCFIINKNEVNTFDYEKLFSELSINQIKKFNKLILQKIVEVV